MIIYINLGGTIGLGLDFGARLRIWISFLLNTAPADILLRG